ncbi:LutC/YkgG family protein [Virgibacillus siamensis]|uniref:LutC/YkgG family protein n=1 Tax=Virgibacillus siamensis TaxID=480071 RepID=UPI0009870C85|nr:lactate utilization protein C [Virgibacillus siamensis]
MTIQNRESFLDNLAAKMGRARRKEGVERPEWSVRPQDKVLPDATPDELVDVLEKHCEVIHTNFKRTDRDGLLTVLRETIQEFDGNTIVASNDARNAAYNLDELFSIMATEGNEVHLWDETKGEENKQIAERADVGITFSDITLAESGTVTLFNNKHNGRAISLMPRTYIAIIPKSTIVPRMTQAAQHIHANHAKGKDVSSCVSFVTGPSNSADIEMNLIVGVHGPVEVTYIVVDD